MRRLVFRDIYGNNPRKHEVSIEETNDRLRSKVSRKLVSKYFISEVYKSKDAKDLEQWIRLNKESDEPRNCHVMTVIDSKTGESKMVCKVLGTFYVVYEEVACKIVYINEIKIRTLNEKKVRNEGRTI